MEFKKLWFTGDDLTEQRKVVQHIRDLLNLAPLLAKGLDEELRLFIHRLKEIGWGDKNISQMLTFAGQGSRFERMKDRNGSRLIPRAIPEQGDQAEWRTLKPRAK